MTNETDHYDQLQTKILYGGQPPSSLRATPQDPYKQSAEIGVMSDKMTTYQCLVPISPSLIIGRSRCLQNSQEFLGVSQAADSDQGDGTEAQRTRHGGSLTCSSLTSLKSEGVMPTGPHSRPQLKRTERQLTKLPGIPGSFADAYARNVASS